MQAREPTQEAATASFSAPATRYVLKEVTHNDAIWVPVKPQTQLLVKGYLNGV